MKSADVTRCVRDLKERGFTYIPSLYSPDECKQMEDALDAHWRRQGSPPFTASHGFGFTIHPLAPAVPELMPFLDRPVVYEILSEVLEDEVKCTHLGSRISDGQSSDRIPWHHHYGWDAAGLPGRKKLERLLIGPYVNGTMDEVGPVIMYPRRFDEPLGEMKGDSLAAWPGEVRLNVPPGSMSIFDTAVWHAAARGTKPGKRRLWGGHFQGWSDPRPHVEDNAVDVPEIESYLEGRPTLRKYVKGK